MRARRLASLPRQRYRLPVGVYYHYCNLDRREYFSVGLGHQGTKRSCIGGGWGARAFGLLLVEQGRWCGHRVAVLGDDHRIAEVLQPLAPADAVDNRDVLVSTFRDVLREALWVLVEEDADDLVRAVHEDRSGGLLRLLPSMAFYADSGDRRFAEFLACHFGRGWRGSLAAHVARDA